MKVKKNFYDGNYQVSVSNLTTDIYNPATGEVISKSPCSNKKDFDKVIQSSIKGYQIWRDYTPLKRSRILSKYKDLIWPSLRSSLINKTSGDNILE